jgi:hypothetical protein
MQNRQRVAPAGRCFARTCAGFPTYGRHGSFCSAPCQDSWIALGVGLPQQQVWHSMHVLGRGPSGDCMHACPQEGSPAAGVAAMHAH